MNPRDIVEQVTALAEPVAEQLGLQLVAVAYQTHTKPATLRVDIRHPTEGTGLDDCEKMSRALEALLDTRDDLIIGAYNLEVSSPGVERVLTTDREFVAFRGFAVMVRTFGPVDGKKQWEGRLLERDGENIYLTVAGRRVALPRPQVARVQLVQSRP
ncbi:MAG: ribosome maturation factor RimP [Aphanocapsa lilacina HA4352-LM1]|jgi:ribosome maturation factor RimP|nr:ribosome maturation factor RimP [Aphanocapsa lilacina HA4352-LM1]